MTTAAPNDDILRKIKKALALAADDRGDPNTAAIALRQAQKLMELHGIDMKAIGRAALGEYNLDSAVSISKAKQWEVNLMVRVGRAFGCKLFWRKGMGPEAPSTKDGYFGTYTFIGEKTRAELAQYTAEVMLKKLKRARTDFVAKLPEFMTRMRKSAEGDAFCLGWVVAVTKTIQEFANPTDVEAAIDALLLEHTNGKHNKPKQGAAASTLSRLAGLNAGSKESIHRPVHGSESKLLRIAA